jgi:ketosteroid isomerase-like protein
MSQENVDRFSEAFKSWNRQDLAGVLRIMDPEIRLEHRLAAFQEGTYVRLEGVTAFLADFAENFETWEIECRDVRDLGDRVLALGIMRAAGKGSGVQTGLRFTVVARFSKGRITHFIDFGDKQQALKAAGVRE